MVEVPLVVVANKSDLQVADGYLSMSTEKGEGIDAVLTEILSHKPPVTKNRPAPSPVKIQE